jgi:hypothetical protein
VILLCILIVSIWVACRHILPARDEPAADLANGARDRNVLLMLAALSLLIGSFTTLWQGQRALKRVAIGGSTDCYSISRIVADSLVYLLSSLGSSSVILLLAILLSYRIRGSGGQES